MGRRRRRKRDLKQIDDIANQLGMDDDEKQDFGEFIEECKAHGDGGEKNDRGDFTWPELKRKAREFLGLPEEA